MKFGLSDCKPCYTPASLDPLRKPDVPKQVSYPYREAIGSLMYLMLCTRPDIANALGCVAKYCCLPKPKFAKDVNKIGLKDYRQGKVLKITYFSE